MICLIGIENIIIQRLKKEALMREIIKSQSTDSIYIKTNRGLRIRIANHKGHKNVKIIDLLYIKTLENPIETIKDRKALLKYRQYVKELFNQQPKG